MATVDIKVTGLPETISNIESLPEGIRQNVIMAALRIALEPIYASAKNYVPVLYGFLKEHITRKTSRMKDGVSFIGMVGILTGGEPLDIATEGRRKGQEIIVYPAMYGAFVEQGTSKREATPFLRPALEDQAGNAANLFAIQAEEEIDKLVEKAVYGSVSRL
jgi:HK97 gp10 family phage protein